LAQTTDDAADRTPEAGTDVTFKRNQLGEGLLLGIGLSALAIVSLKLLREPFYGYAWSTTFNGFAQPAPDFDVIGRYREGSSLHRCTQHSAQGNVTSAARL
jgi:hypothetical protein